MASTSTTERTATGGARATSSFRPDIEGLRALAVISVVLWHADVPYLRGGFVGVDVFFVISGFLMTGILLRELANDGRIKLLDFYSRRIKRLLPASALTLVATLAATWAFLPSSRHTAIAYDALAAATYVANWRFADSSVNYLTQTDSESPVQHFWSLAVEEQYYIVWPLLLSSLAFLVARRLVTARVLVLIVLVLLFSTSLAWSIYLSEIDPARAYFVTTTRVWELALGGIVAVVVHKSAKVRTDVSALLAWLGTGAIVSSFFFFQTSMEFPGWIALIPTLGTALVIAFTPRAAYRGPTGLLSLAPFQWFGRISYSWYLWHWPVIVIGTQLITKGSRDASVAESLGLAIASLIPAWLSLRYVENPLRRARWTNDTLGNTYFIGLVATSVSAALAMTMGIATRQPEPYSPAVLAQVTGERSESNVAKVIGAMVLGDEPNDSPDSGGQGQSNSLTPSPSIANRVTLPHSNCHSDLEEADFHVCRFGAIGAPVTLAVVGDSHAGQWVAPMISIAERNGWELNVSTKSACPLLDTPLLTAQFAPYLSCQEWYRSAIDWLNSDDAPDLLLVSQSNYRQFSQEGTAGIQVGLARMVESARATGVTVGLIRDTPYPGLNVAECVESNPGDFHVCDVPKEEALSRRDSVQPIVAAQTGVDLIDLTDWVCPQDTCPAVIGDVLVYRDTNHLSLPYSLSLADQLEKQLRPLVDGL